MSGSDPPLYYARFADHLLDVRAGELHGSNGGEPIRLPEQSLRILLLLLERPLGVVQREEIQKKLWPNDTIVEFEHSISAAMNRLRQALGDSADKPRYVETLARRGYRWMVAVEWEDNGPGQQASLDSTTKSAEPSNGNLIGKKVSHYRVMRIIGGGGMGVVYEAEDLKLGRRVAMKFLPNELETDSQTLKRFEREARTASSLNHPNICTIYELGEHEGQPFIVMTLLRGQTLRERVASGDRLTLDEILDFAIQVADGLDAAHQNGIIHRDIKPANIFLTDEGVCKILDFGLAKLLEMSDDEELAAQTSAPSAALPTSSVTLSLTRTGIAMGTASYMSPEQVRAQELDARSDLFSFGVVLYEMATGLSPFPGESSGVISKTILDGTPTPAVRLNPDMPLELERIINKALEKDLNLRYQRAAEIRTDLQRLKRDSESSSAARDLPPDSRTRRLWVGAAVLVALVAATVAGVGISWWLRPAASQVLTERRITANSPDAPVTGAVISPDGKYVAYSDSTGVYIRHIDSGETRPLQLPKGFNAVPMSWFPDSTHVLLTVAEAGKEVLGLWKASILGGSPQLVLDDANGGVVSPDGSKIAFLRATGDELGIWTSNGDGSDAKRIVSGVGPALSTRAGAWASDPLYVGSVAPRLAWSPRGIRIAFTRGTWFANADPVTANNNTLETVDIAGGTPKVVMQSAQLWPAMVWAPNERMLFAKQEGLANERGDVGVWSLRVREQSGEAGGSPVAVSKGAGRVGGLSVSADGKRVVLWRASTQPEVFVAEIDSGSHRLLPPRRVTLDQNANVSSSWTPDGRGVLFTSNRSGTWKIFRQAIDQVTPEVVTEVGRVSFLPRLNSDGTHLLHLAGSTVGNETSGRLVEVPLEGGPARVVLQMPFLYNHQCARSPSSVCVLNTLEKNRVKFFTFDAQNGSYQGFATFPGHADWSLSPEGSQLAIVFPNAEPRITFMTIRDKSTHDVELNGWAHARNVDWTAHGKSVYVVAQRPDGTDTVLEVEPSGKQDVLLEGDKNARFWWAIQSPDGRHVLLEQVIGENNVWMVENL